MTNEHELILKSLKDKVKVIISLYERARDEAQELQNEREELLQKIEDKDKAYKELEEKHEVLKLAKTVAGTSENSHEAKIKINRIVREIDKCIAMMNR